MLKTCARCPTPIPGGITLCPDCKRKDNQRRRQKASKHGLHTRGWQLLRRARLNMDRGMCTYQYGGCTVVATTVHLDPALGGDHRMATLADLRSACHHCHGIIDARRAHIQEARG